MSPHPARRHGFMPICSAAAVMAVTLAVPVAAEDRALVIGIDDYTALSPPLSLSQAGADAERFADFLTTRAGFNASQVTVLKDAAANSDSILQEVIDVLLGQTGPGDRIVLYFAGLGTTIAAADGQSIAALVAHDGDSALGLIPADFFAELFDLAGDRQITMVLDAGFHTETDSGAEQVARLRSLGGNGPADLAAFGAGPGRQIWTAAGAASAAFESGEGGVLTAYLLEGMAGVADADGNRIVTNDELIDHLTARAGQWCEALPACPETGQVPEVLGAEAAGGAPAFIPSHLLPQVAAEPAMSAPLTHEAMIAFIAELFGPNNAAGLSVSLADGPDLRIGDEVRFRVGAGQSGAMVLLDIDTEGNLAQIFPSALAPGEGTGIRANEVLTIPSGLSANGLPLRVRATGPAGQGILLALFTQGDAARLAEVLPAGLEDGAQPGAGRHLFAIAQDLLRRDGDPATRLDWSAAWLSYTVSP